MGRGKKTDDNDGGEVTPANGDAGGGGGGDGGGGDAGGDKEQKYKVKYRESRARCAALEKELQQEKSSHAETTTRLETALADLGRATSALEVATKECWVVSTPIPVENKSYSTIEDA